LGSELSNEGNIEIIIEYISGAKITLPIRWIKNNADKPVINYYDISGIASAYCSTSSGTIIPPMPPIFNKLLLT